MAFGRDPNAGLSLRKNFSWTFAGNLLTAGCQWGMMVALAKLGSPEKVGRFALGYAVTAPVIMFANLHLSTVLATDARRSHPFGNYLALRSTTSSLAVLVIIGIAVFSRYSMDTALVILAIGGAKVFEALSDIYYGLLQHHERMDRIAKSAMMKGPLSLAALGGAFYLTRSILWAAIALMVAFGIVLLFYDSRSTKLISKVMKHRTESSVGDDTIRAYLRPCWQFGPLCNLAGIALPLGIVMLFISLNVNIPRYFIERYLGEKDLGIFAAMTYPMAAGSLLVSALAASAIPRLSKYFAAGNVSAFRKLLLRLVAFGGLIGALGIIVVKVAGHWILNLFYGPEYAAHNAIFMWIAAASAMHFVQWFLGDGLTAARYFKVQPLLLGMVTVITVLASLWLIPAYGLKGAAYVLLVGNSVLTLGILIADIFAIGRLQRSKG